MVEPIKRPENGADLAGEGERTANGRFAPGNPGGPGRPTRPIEREYLVKLTEAVPPDAWFKICERAAQDALEGDYRAREWIGRLLVGPKPQPLLQVALLEAAGVTALDEMVSGASRGDCRSLVHEAWRRPRVPRLQEGKILRCQCDCSCTGPAFDEREDGLLVCETCRRIALGPIDQGVCERRTDRFRRCHQCGKAITWLEPSAEYPDPYGSCGCADRYWSMEFRDTGWGFRFGASARRADT